MKQDRFLLGILIGIAVLVFVAVLAFFLRTPRLEYQADDLPAGVVHNYIVAIQTKDSKKAYTYLADLPNKPSESDFWQTISTQEIRQGIEIVSTETNADRAIVRVRMHSPNNDPFRTASAYEESVFLVLQNGMWKLSQMPYEYWGYNWYQEAQK